MLVAIYAVIILLHLAGLCGAMENVRWLEKLGQILTHDVYSQQTKEVRGRVSRSTASPDQKRPYSILWK